MNRETGYDKSKSFGTEVVTKAGYMRFTLIGNGANEVEPPDAYPAGWQAV